KSFSKKEDLTNLLRRDRESRVSQVMTRTTWRNKILASRSLALQDALWQIQITMTKQLLRRSMFSLLVFVSATNAYGQSAKPVTITNTPLAHVEIKPSDLPPAKLENDINNAP